MTEATAGRVALVTGAGRNIGRAIALALASDGCAVAVNVRASIPEGEAVVDTIAASGGQALLVAADISDRAAVDAMIAAVGDRFGRLDILVNNAAVRDEVPFDALDFATWRRAQSVCLDGAFHCTQAALPLLRASGRACVVNIGGLTSHTGATRRVHVISAKAGLVGFTRALAHELAPDGVTVNCVAPGMMETRRTGAEPHHHRSQQTLLGRRGLPEEIGAAVCWLAGDGGRFVTGQVIHVNGGAYLGS
jgi:3-oxoacyl-[acyl-carrier protein] reductase